MHVGDFHVTPLSDGEFRLDGGAMFGIVPKPLWERRAPADARNRIRLAIRPLLVRTATHTVLVDAGVGDKMGEKDADVLALDRTSTLLQSLAAEGVAPAEVDIVLLSHLHLDHAGGLTSLVEGRLTPVFPRARHVIRRGEWEDATHPHERSRASYIPEDFVPLMHAGLVDLIDHDGDVLPGISVWRTGGHTRHHQVIRLHSRGRTAVFAADLLPTTAHLDEPWIMGYDLYPMETLAYKKRLLQEASDGEYVIFFEHDTAVVAGVIRREDRRWRVEPVLTASAVPPE